MMGLSDGRKSFPIGLAVLIQYRSVTATQPASQVAVAITLNAKASSLKTRRMGLLGRERNLTISSTMWIQYTNVSDKWTDGQTECLSCTVSEIDGENCKFLTPVYLTLPLRFCNGVWLRKQLSSADADKLARRV